MAGLFFCLASAEGAGLLFCPIAIQPDTIVYSVFCTVHAVIPPTPQNNAQGFTGAFPSICHILCLLSGGASCYAVQPAPLWSVSQRRSTSSAYQIPTPRRTLYRSAQAAYYNKVYKGAAHRRPCKPGGVDRWQVLTHCQQYRPGAPAEGSASPPVQGQPGGVGSSDRSAAGGAEPLAATAASFFGLLPDSQ